MRKVRVSKHFRSEYPRGDTVALIAARGAKTPSDYLVNLIQHSNYRVRIAVAKNRCTPKTLIQYLFTHPNIEMRKLVAHSPHATGVQLEAIRRELASDLFDETLAAVARNKRTLPETLRTLAQETYPWYITVEIAKNVNTPVNALIEMSFSRRELIKSTVARHPKLPMYRLLELLSDKKAIIRRNALKNPNAPFERIQAGLKDHRQTVRDSAHRILTSNRK